MSSLCPICFEILADKCRATTNVCDHIFCLQCLQTWSKNGDFCPIDRKKFKKIISLDSGISIKVKPRKRKIGRTFYDVTVYCEVCKTTISGSTLLLCDSCDLGYHLECLSPPLEAIPRGRWHCPDCVAVELRLRTNAATPADTSYAKRVRKKKRKKLELKTRKEKVTSQRKYFRQRRIHHSQSRQSSRKIVSSTLTKIRHCLKEQNIYTENNSDSHHTTNSQNNDQPGPSHAIASTSNITSYSLDDIDLDDFFSSSDETAVDANRDMNNAHQQEQRNVESNSAESDFFGFGDTDFKFSSSDDSTAEDSKRDIDKGCKQDKASSFHSGKSASRNKVDSSEFGDSDFDISFSDDSETGRERKTTITTRQQPPASESNLNSDDDDYFKNYDFEFSSSDENEQRQSVTSGNHPELFGKVNNTESAVSTTGGASFDMGDSPSFSISDSDFETSSSEEKENLKSGTENGQHENNCDNADTLYKTKIEDEFKQRNNLSPQNKDEFDSDFSNSSFKNYENQIKTDNVSKEMLSSSTQQRALFDLDKSPPFIISDFHVDSTMEDMVEGTNNVFHQSNSNFSSDINQSPFENQVHTSENSVLHQESQVVSMDGFNPSSSEDGGNSLQSAAMSTDDRCEKEKEATVETTSSSSNSLDCGFSDYPEAIVLKLPLRLSFKRGSSTFNKPGPSSHLSMESDISANVCRITEVTSCPPGLFQNFNSESLVSTNQNLHSVETNESPQSTFVSSDKQVNGNSSTVHCSNTSRITFSLIESKSSKLPQSERMYTYRSFVSGKDPSSGQTRSAGMNKLGGSSSRGAEDVTSYSRHFGHEDVCHTCPLKSVANKTLPTKTYVRNEFKLDTEETGKVIIPPNLSGLFKNRIFIKDVEQLSARKDGALFLNWRKRIS